MLSYTTYNIPESAESKTAGFEKWLWLIVSQPPTAKDSDLLQKISIALQADFMQNVHCIQQDKMSNGSLSDLLDHHVNLVISFGIAPSSLGIWIDLQNPGIRFLESFAFILTTDLEDLNTNAMAKKELWKCMQKYMELK